MPRFDALPRVLLILLNLLVDTLRLASLALRSHTALTAQSLFQRNQLALFLERQVKPRRADDATRLTLVFLRRLFAWKQALMIVKPETLIRWHRQAFRLFWRLKSRPRGRPHVPINLQNLIREMATRNPTWGEERIAAELLLKLGIRISPRTVRHYRPLRRARVLSVLAQ